jgi:hypothetical protein
MPLPPFEVLAGASLNSLQEMELKALNQSANFSKDVRFSIEQWVEALAMALIARWLIDSRKARPPAPPRQLSLWDKDSIRGDLPKTG